MEAIGVSDPRIYRLREWKDGSLMINLREIYAILEKGDQEIMTIPPFGEIADGKERNYFIVEGDTMQVVGCGAVLVEGGYIKRLFILPEYQGKGYGKFFVGKAEDLLREEGREYCNVYVKRVNMRGICWWIRQGYTLFPTSMNDTGTSLYLHHIL